MPKRIKRRVTGVQLSEAEKALLVELSIEAGMTMSAYVRELLKRAGRDRKTIQIPRKQRLAEYV